MVKFPQVVCKISCSQITGSAVALHCSKAHAKINRTMGNLTPCKIVTPKNIILKLCTRDYVGEVTRHANFGFNLYSGGFSPNMRNITTLWLFLTALCCPYFFSRSCAQVKPLNRFSRFMAQMTCFHPWVLGVRTMGDHIWGNMPPKMGMNRQFQAKTAKYKYCNISKTINRIKTKFEEQAETDNCT